MTIVPLLALLGASCWLIFRSLSLPGPLLASFLASLNLSEPLLTLFYRFFLILQAPELSRNLENQ